MKNQRILAVAWLIAFCRPVAVEARVWTEATGRYTFDAKLVTFNERSVVLQRDDHELVAIPIEELSDKDREFLNSKEAGDAARAAAEGTQSWTLRDGTKLVGRIVDYATRDLTLQRRRGRNYVNDRAFGNLPEFYQQLLPSIVAQFEDLPRADRRSLDAWFVRQRGEPRTFHLDGVVLETENGDEYGVPFALFSDDDLKVLKPGWQSWLAAHDKKDVREEEDLAFLLRSLAVARHNDSQIQHQIAMMQLKLQAVKAGLTSLWEVTLFPAANGGGRPLWVVVPGRNSRDATEAALHLNPGYVAGPVRRVSR
jgi:hypothetical protein